RRRDIVRRPRAATCAAGARGPQCRGGDDGRGAAVPDRRPARGAGPSAHPRHGAALSGGLGRLRFAAGVLPVAGAAMSDLAILPQDQADKLAREVVTPEGVVVHVRLAAASARLGALILDLLILFAALIVVGLL